MAKKHAVSFKLNGKPVDVLVEPRELLIHTCARSSQHTGPHIGCETSHCGACTVDLDGMSVKSCTVLTVQCEDAEVLTIEGFEQGGALHALQEGFTQRARPAVRLLHARHDHARLPAAARRTRARQRRGDPLLDGGQPLPLHRLPEHRQGGAVRGARSWRRRAPEPLRRQAFAPGDIAMAAQPTRSSARPSCREWAPRGCARKTRASSAARAPTSTTSSCRACCSARIVRSPYAHARIKSIDKSKALAVPGVVAVLDRRRPEAGQAALDADARRRRPGRARRQEGLLPAAGSGDGDRERPLHRRRRRRRGGGRLRGAAGDRRSAQVDGARTRRSFARTSPTRTRSATASAPIRTTSSPGKRATRQRPTRRSPAPR